MEKLRKRYPAHVPVICVSSCDQSRQEKLIVPNHTTGAGFIAIALDKCAWATKSSKVLLCKGSLNGEALEVPTQKAMKELDSQYKALDGAMYFKVEAAEAAEAAKEASQEVPHKDAGGPQQFRMNEAVPPEQKSKASIPAARKDDPAEKARRIRKKHPDRVPVLINQAEAPGLPALDKKLLIPMNMTCGDLRKNLPKHIGWDVDWSKVTFQLAGDDVEEHELVSEVYARRVEPDDEGIMLSLELPTLQSSQVPQLAGETRGLKETAAEVAYDASVASSNFSPPSAEELRVLEHQLLEVNAAFDEARKAKELATAKLAEEEERAWAAEEKALKADQELAVQCQMYRSQEEALQRQIKEAKFSQGALETKLVSGMEEIRALRQKVDGLEVTLQTSKTQAEKDSCKIAELQQFLKEALASLAVEAKKKDAAQERLSELEEKLREATANEAEAKKMSQMNSGERDEAEERVSVLENSLKHMAGKQKPDEAAKRLKDTIIILKDALCSKEEELASKGIHIAETTACLKTVETENRRLQAELEAAAKERNQLKQDHARAVEEIESLKAKTCKQDAEEDFTFLGWNSEGEVQEVTEDFGFERVDKVDKADGA